MRAAVSAGFYEFATHMPLVEPGEIRICVRLPREQHPRRRLKSITSPYNIPRCYMEILRTSISTLTTRLASSSNHAAQKAGESRNALIRRAVAEWLERHGRPQWPDEVLSFKGMADMTLFEAGRDKRARQLPIRWHEVFARYVHG